MKDKDIAALIEMCSDFLEKDVGTRVPVGNTRASVAGPLHPTRLDARLVSISGTQQKTSRRTKHSWLTRNAPIRLRHLSAVVVVHQASRVNVPWDSISDIVCPTRKRRSFAETKD